jgi:signal transduction histidine kinase
MIEFIRLFFSPGYEQMKNKNAALRFAAWFDNLPIPDPVDRRMAVLVQVLLFGFMGIVLIASLLNLTLLQAAPIWQVILQTLIFLTILFIPLVLLRRGYFQASAHIIIAVFLLLETFAVLTAGLVEIAETLAFYTLVIILAGLLAKRPTLLVAFLVSAAAVAVAAAREQDSVTRLDAQVVAGNFILLNGLISLFIDRFGNTLRTSLKASLQREAELETEVNIRRQAEAALERFADRLEVIHEIDRAILTTHSLVEIAQFALDRIRRLIPCPRASVTLFDFEKNDARFLAVSTDERMTPPDTPITTKEYGLDVIDKLKEDKSWSTNDILDHPHVTELSRKLAEEHGIRSWLCLPLLYQDTLIGALNLGRGPGESFNREDTEIACDVADQLAIVLQQTNLYNALQTELTVRKKLISELESINAELERFTYTVSHDLRNPLVTIKGFLGMLEKDIREGNLDRVEDDLHRISNAADKMHILLSELLELSRIGRIMNPPEEVDLGEVVREAIESLDARLRSTMMTVNSPLDLPTVYGDRTRLREVFENLIDNAVKYAGDRPDPCIEIGTRIGDQGTVIYVKDNGIGIEPQYHGKIFGLFEQLNPGNDGTGIGLALVKRIIETHGGNIWVESEGRGKGSAFCFTIPDSRLE